MTRNCENCESSVVRNGEELYCPLKMSDVDRDYVCKRWQRIRDGLPEE